MKQIRRKKTDLPFLRKIVYIFIIILIPIIFISLFGLVLWLVNYGDNLDLFIGHPDELYKEYKIVNPVIGKKYFQKLEYTSPANDVFLKEKPENCFRIFVMGSSTVIGFPYDNNLMFSRILQERLQDCYPEKYIEVVNTAITAINSFTLLDYIGQVLKEEPDAILIYAGHNEFYGAFGVGSNEAMSRFRGLALLHINLMKFRFYQFLQHIIIKIAGNFKGKSNDANVRGTLMKRIVANKEIVYKSKIYNIGIKHYAKNINRILKKTNRKNIPVFISELISNVKDLEPFCSSGADEFPAASDVYNDALKYEAEGNMEQAKENYYFAKDLDCIRFRASEQINEIIHQLAEEYDAKLVPMKLYFEKKSPSNLIGNNLITEHVHPNINGYFLMADVFFNELVKSKIIGDFNIVYYKSSEYYKRNWGYTELDSLLAVHRITNLSYHWPFQPIDAPYVDYRAIYKPKSFVDSLAFTIMTSKELKGDEAHLELGRYYKEKGDFYKAYKEFYAAIKCFPYWANDYLEAAGCLINIKDFSTALKFINMSLEMDESFYGYYKKGEILIMKGEYSEAIESLNKAQVLVKDSLNMEKLFSKMLEAYFFAGQEQKAKGILDELKKLNPDYEPAFSTQKVNYAMLIPVQVEKQVLRAIEYFKKGDMDKALNEFIRSLEIKETPIANRLTGEILIRKKDKNAIIYYLRAYPEFSKDVDFLYNLSILYLHNRMPDKARNILENIIQINPDYSNIPQLEKYIQAQYP